MKYPVAIVAVLLLPLTSLHAAEVKLVGNSIFVNVRLGAGGSRRGAGGFRPRL